MDYFTGCSELSTTNPRCDPTMSLFWLAPWLSYANFLLAAKNRTVLIDVGVAMDPANATTGHPNYPNNHWISSELDLESFFHRSYGSIKSLQGEGPTSGDPGMLPPFMKSWCTVSARLCSRLLRTTFLAGSASSHRRCVPGRHDQPHELRPPPRTLPQLCDLHGRLLPHAGAGEALPSRPPLLRPGRVAPDPRHLVVRAAPLPPCPRGVF